MEDFNNDSFLSEDSFLEEGDFIGVDDAEEGGFSDSGENEEEEEAMDFEPEDEY